MSHPHQSKKRIAIVGSAFRFPGTDREHFWQDLLDGKDLVSRVAPDRWGQDAFLHPDKSHPGSAYTFAAGALGDVAGFDAAFFGISPREAAQMDPQQRLLLEMAWESLESAGIKPSAMRGSQCGVFIGLASADYSYRLADDLAAIDASTATGNTASLAANRLSYFFDWHGPSMAIDTACSSSLVAFHQACRAIASGEVPCALTGGISLHLHPYGFIIFSKASMLSPRGRCNTFDADGDGYVRSEGGGLFLLKDYELAIADGDPILAVVAHSAVNTDGRKSGITVPNPKAQAALLEAAYTQAGIDPNDIDYIEAHGTGTAIGDPLETSALGEALGKRRRTGSPLPIGSIKSNLGHMETASGVAGLAKALYALKHRIVPGTIGIKTLNPKIRLQEWNLDVVRQNRPLKACGKLTIGINSFGFGGANAHVILESHAEASPASPASADTTPPPLLISARSAEGLRAHAAAVAERLGQTDADLYDIAWHALSHRELFEHRAVIFASDCQHAAQALRRFAAGESEAAVHNGSALPQASGPAFIYSGNGSQWFGMGRALLNDPVFAGALQRVDQHFLPLAGFSLIDELARDQDANRLELTEIAQPCLFAIQVGVTEMLRTQGVLPQAVCGHSVGEVAAAWACGALSLAQAVKVIYHRSRLQGLTRGQGAMSAVGLAADAAQALLKELGLQQVCIAGINSCKGVTLAGNAAELARLEAHLEGQKTFCKRLPLDYAFHSPAMDSIEQPLREALSTLSPASADTPYYSTVSGGLLAGTALNADYWWHNIRQPVAFGAAVQAMLASGMNEFIEIGPHPVLRGYLNEALKDAGQSGRIIPTGRRGDDSPARLLTTCAEHMVAGGQMDWSVHFPVAGRFTDFPTYVWQRERHWHPTTREALGLLSQSPCHPLLGHALSTQPNQWENVLDTDVQPMLADHVVGDAIVFPGAGYVELVLAVAREKYSAAQIEVEALEIRAPLLFSAGHSQKLRITLDEADGRLSILAREFAGQGDWSVHTVARLLAEPGTRLLEQARWPGAPAREADFDQDSHLALNRALGLNYGPAFQAIECGWLAGDEALACLAMPATILPQLGDYLLHPGVLDSSFQLIAQLLREHSHHANGLAFIPTRIGRLALRSGAGVARFTRVHLRRHSPHSLLADFSLFDAQGQAIAVLEEVRFRAVRLFRSQAEQVQRLETRLHAAPLPRSESLIRQGELTAALRAITDLTSANTYDTELSPLLDALQRAYLRELLEHSLAAHPEGLGAWFEQLDAHRTDSARVIEHLRAAWQRHGLLDAQFHPRIDTDEEESASADAIWQLLLREYPDHFPLLHTIGHLAHQLASLLAGRQQNQPALPAGFSAASLSRHILGPLRLEQITQTLRTTIRARLTELAPGQRLRILEVADAAPCFASKLCPDLPASQSDYCFASRHAEHAAMVRELATRHAALGFQPLSESTPPTHDHDLALVLLDGLAGEDAARMLRFARTQLAAQGTLLLIASQPEEWLQSSLGFAGLAAPDDGATLLQQVRQAGFMHAEWLTNTTTGACLLLATAPASLSPPRQAGHWLLVSEAGGDAAALSQALQAQLITLGDTASICPADAPTLLAALHELPQPCSGILMLSGFSTQDEPPALDALTLRCQIASRLALACEQAQIAAPLLLITHRALNELLPSTALARHTSSDAALWGFGRSLANETQQPVRLIDLQHDDPLELARQLAHSLVTDCTEPELLLDPQGARFATRLRLLQPAAVSETWKLGFSLPGQLRNLGWQAHTLPTLQDDELEIQVEATGLNFRDVMYALGLLSDEALENGFAGATLGLEFSGTVIRCGQQAPGFAPGDRVVGFASACFANRLITRASTVAPIPAGMSFEAAATIPTTFFTAWYALHHLARLEAGERVLIHGGAGGVGIAAIQIARRLGATVYATAGSDEKREFLRLLGADHILDSRSLSYADDILSLTAGEGVDVVLNSLAGEAINRNFQILKPFGRFLELGKRDFYENTRVGLRPFRNNLTYFGIDADQLMRARPELTRRLFGEVMALFAQGEFHPLPWQAFEASQVVEAFRHMQQARQIGKIVVTYRDGIHGQGLPAPVSTRLQLDTQGSYLVTGGLAGFGLRSAEWLVERGARHLILISRSGPQGSEAQAALARLKAQGITVLAEACDVTHLDALQKLLQRPGLPPLRGIVHAAAVIEDALIRNLDAAQIQRVLAPKILGAQHLHQLSEDMSLDFFVLYSSATTLFGNPGQAAYVAANSWLEAFARQRRAQGLPATCLLWGAIDDAGFLARNEKIKEALQSRMGGAALRAAVALDLLEAQLLGGQSGQAILELDWHALSRFLPTAASPRYAELRRLFGEGGQHDDGGKDLRQLLGELSDEEVHAVVADMLRHELGEILRIAPEKIAADRPIQELGMDSLMGVELVIALEDRFGIRLPVLALSESPTIARLADRLITQLREQDGAPPDSRAELNSQVQQLAAAHAHDSSADTMSELTRQLNTAPTGERLIHS